MSYKDSVTAESTHNMRQKLGTPTVIYIAFLLLAPFAGVDANAADATERTVMPDFCSRRDVNCVLPDGAAPRVNAPSAPLSGSGASAATVVIQSDAPGLTTVVTPSTSTVPSVSTAPASAPTPALGSTAAGATGSSATSASGTAITETTNRGTTPAGATSGDRR